MKSAARFLILAILALLAGAVPAPAQSERILNFKSFIQVHSDASMTVTEEITVRADRQEIKRGIVRDFPTTYRDRLGNTVTVGFQVEEVLRDGRSEPYRIESAANGVKIRIGQKDVFLRPGDYTYTIRYRVDRELGFFKDFDELYWNVTGNHRPGRSRHRAAPWGENPEIRGLHRLSGRPGPRFHRAGRGPRHCFQDHPGVGPP
jgi:hypothetical protein